MRETLAIEDPDISTHAPRTGSDRLSSATRSIWANFNPRSPHGERLTVEPQNGQGYDFNPRSPHGERRLKAGRQREMNTFQPTLPARGATRMLDNQIARTFISTHAPRTGSDPIGFKSSAGHPAISTHAPRTGSDGAGLPNQPDHDISTHAPRTGSDMSARAQRTPTGAISTHAPRTGSDAGVCRKRHGDGISTHAPRTGSDPPIFRGQAVLIYFNPRSPHGERASLSRRRVAVGSNFNPRSPHGERRYTLSHADRRP